MSLDPINPDIAQNSLCVSDGEIQTLSKHEAEELNDLNISNDLQLTVIGIEALGGVLALIPKFKGHVQPMGCSATVDFGGDHLHFSSSQLAAAAREGAGQFSYMATMAGKLGSYSRRELDWTFQSNSAKSDINQIFKQIRGAQIREAIAKNEYDNHLTEMANAQQIVDFLQGNSVGGKFPAKETTIGFYTYLKREAKALYSNTFQLAFRGREEGGAVPAKRVRRSHAELHPIQLSGRKRRAVGRREVDARLADNGDGVPRPKPA